MSVAAAFLLLAAQTDAPELAREFELRAAVVAGARFPGQRASPDWRQRAFALVCIERAARAGFARAPEDLAHARGALADAHPSVRARAWHALAALGQGDLTAEELARGARETPASVRLAVARALAFVQAPGRAALAAELAFDGDERVRRAARGALLGLEANEPCRTGALAEACLRLAAEEDEAAFAELCAGLLAGGLEPEELACVRAAARDEGRATLAEALAFAGGAEGDAERLARGLAGPRDADWDPLRARLVAAAGKAQSAALARALLAGLGPQEPPSLGREARLALLVASLPRGSAWSWLAEHVERPELLAELVPALAAEEERLETAVAARWLAPEAPAGLRSAVVAAAAAVFTRTRGTESEALLVRALGAREADVAARAFEALASAPALARASEAALLAAWRALDAAEQPAALGRFTRARAFPFLRDEWLALGARVPAARGALGELLAAFAEDAPAAEALRGWLAEDLAAVARAGELARELEQRVQAELRALARLAPGSVADFASALTVARGRSSEIGKLAVAALAKSPAGRGELALRLARGEFAAEADRRMRIEAGIQLAEALRGPARTPAVTLLLAERENAAFELRERMLVALAVGAEAEPLAALRALLLAPETEAVERITLVALLAEHQGEAAAPALFALLASELEFEARRGALTAFAAWPGQADALARWLARPAPEGYAEEAALLAAEARVALAAAAPAHSGLAGWLAAPLARAAADLAARLHGRELPAVEFAWRQELEIARRLARAGTLGPVLAAEGDWLRLDGRLLGELGRAALPGDPVRARQLTRAALLALLGERDPDVRDVLGLEGRLCALAARAGAAAECRARLARLFAARRTGSLGDSDWSALAEALVPDAHDPDAALRALAAGAR